MALNKLVDGAQLDADLTSVAAAIRTKGGTSAQLQFPTGFVSAVEAIPTGITPSGTKTISITENGTTTENVAAYANAEITVDVQGGGGDPYTVARSLLNNTATEYIDDTITTLRRGAFYGCKNLTTAQVHNVEHIVYFSAAPSAGVFAGTSVSALAFPKLSANAYPQNYRLFEEASSLQSLDFGTLFTSVPAVCFFGCKLLTTVILRSPTLAKLENINAYKNTPFKSGGTGGTIYIPKALYDHLGDGTMLDYKAATNWSTVDGYGTITWAQIEGSIYETQYADGTPIPTA